MRPEISISIHFIRARETRPCWKGGLRLVGWAELLAGAGAFALLTALAWRTLS